MRRLFSFFFFFVPWLSTDRPLTTEHRIYASTFAAHMKMPKSLTLLTFPVFWIVWLRTKYVEKKRKYWKIYGKKYMFFYCSMISYYFRKTLIFWVISCKYVNITPMSEWFTHNICMTHFSSGFSFYFGIQRLNRFYRRNVYMKTWNVFSWASWKKNKCVKSILIDVIYLNLCQHNSGRAFLI